MATRLPLVKTRASAAAGTTSGRQRIGAEQRNVKRAGRSSRGGTPGTARGPRSCSNRVLTLCPDSSSLCLFECGPSPLNAILNTPLNDIVSGHSTAFVATKRTRTTMTRAWCTYRSRYLAVTCRLSRARGRGRGEGGENNNR